MAVWRGEPPRARPRGAVADLDHRSAEQDQRTASASARDSRVATLTATILPRDRQFSESSYFTRRSRIPFAEARVLKVAHAYQQDTDWHKRVPVLPAVVVSQG